MAEGKIYVSKVDGFADYDGGQVPLRAGVTRVREGHPLLKGREALFDEIQVHYEVETARQAPEPEGKPEAAKSETPKSETPEQEQEPKPVAPKPRGQRGPRKAAGLTSDDTPGS